MKSKREDDFEGDDNEWEEGPSTGEINYNIYLCTLLLSSECCFDREKCCILES